MKVLFDQGVNPRLRNFLRGHETYHSVHIDWNNLPDPMLVRRAEDEGFHVLVTTDKREDRWMQRTGRLSVVILSGNGTKAITASHQQIRAAVERASPGSFEYVELQMWRS